MTVDRSELQELSDEELTSTLAGLARRARQATAALVAHLAVFDSRGLHLRLGHGSLFSYCRTVLRLSAHEAYNRIEAARLASRHPQILERLHDGTLNLTGVRLLAPVLRDDNVDRLLAAAADCGKREIEELVARERPLPDVPDRVRKVPARSVVPDPATSLKVVEPTAIQISAVTPRRPSLEKPLAPDRYEIRFTASKATCDKLAQARDLLRHAVPEGDTATIVDRALTLLLERLTKEKFATTARPRLARVPSSDSRQVSAAVKRAVYARDGGRCANRGSNGRRCDARALLEFHHVKPWAQAGSGTVENVELRCRAHNQYEAHLYFGPILETRGRDLEGKLADEGPGSRHRDARDHSLTWPSSCAVATSRSVVDGTSKTSP